MNVDPTGLITGLAATSTRLLAVFDPQLATLKGSVALFDLATRTLVSRRALVTSNGLDLAETGAALAIQSVVSTLNGAFVVAGKSALFDFGSLWYFRENSEGLLKLHARLDTDSWGIVDTMGNIDGRVYFSVRGGGFPISRTDLCGF